MINRIATPLRHNLPQGLSRSERRTGGKTGGRIYGCRPKESIPTGGNQFLQKIKVLPRLPFIHASFRHIIPCPDSKCGADTRIGVRMAGVCQCPLVIKQIEFILRHRFPNRPFTLLQTMPVGYRHSGNGIFPKIPPHGIGVIHFHPSIRI